MFFKDSYGYDKTSGALTNIAGRLAARSGPIRAAASSPVITDSTKSFLISEGNREYGYKAELTWRDSINTQGYTPSILAREGNGYSTNERKETANILNNARELTPIELANEATFAKTAGIMSSLLAKGFGKSALKLGGTYAASTAGVSALGAYMDDKGRAEHGFLGNFARKMASPKYWALGAGTMAAPVAGRYLGKGAFQGGGKLTSAIGKKVGSRGINRFGVKMQSFGRQAGRGTQTFDRAASISKNMGKGKYNLDEKMLYGTVDRAGKYTAGKGAKVSNRQYYKNLRRSGDIAAPDASFKTTFSKVQGPQPTNVGTPGATAPSKTYNSLKSKLKARNKAIAPRKEGIQSFMNQNSNKYDTIGRTANTQGDRFKSAFSNRQRKAWHLNPFQPMGVMGGVGAATGIVGPWTAGEMMWNEDSAFYKNMNKSKTWAPFSQDHKDPVRFKDYT